MSTSNSLSQLALVYKAIEDTLRRAARDNVGLSMTELRSNPEVSKHENTTFQVRDIVKSLAKKDFVIVDTRDDMPYYRWNLQAPPFVVGQRATRKASTQPSVVTNAMPDSTIIQQVAKIAQEIEVQMGGVTVVIGRNPINGRLRIIVEEL